MLSMIQLQERHLTIYDFAKAYHDQHSYPPTQQEIADALRIPKTTVNRSIERMELLNMVRRVRGKQRGLRLISRSPQSSLNL
jgi:DNA-binding MarR family transcriptional regulator